MTSYQNAIVDGSKISYREAGPKTGGQINSTIEHATAEHGHPEAKAVGRKVA